MFSRNRKNKQWRRNKPGFLMVDAAFSIFVVGIILITFLAVMASVYRTEFAKRDVIIATNLAQEGIEIVRNLRDYNWKYDREAFDGSVINGYDFHELETGGEDLTVQYNSNWIGGPGGNSLKINSDRFYVHSSPNPTTPTKFSRFVDITVDSPESRTVTSRVAWDGKDVVITDILYAWGDAD